MVKPIISITVGQFPADRAFSNKRATRLRAEPVSVYLSYLGICRRKRGFIKPSDKNVRLLNLKIMRYF